MSKAEKRILKRRQVVEPSIGHLKADHCMRRNFLKAALGDAMNPILAAAGFNICWLMRWLVAFLVLDIVPRPAVAESEWLGCPCKRHAGARIAECSGSSI